MPPVIVAIDGPSGVGKSTTSRGVAARLDLPHIDTGAMYRAIALKATRLGVPFDDEARLAELASGAVIAFGVGDEQRQVYLDGERVTEAIRTPEMSMAASTVSAVPAVRRVLVRLQQEMGEREGGVLEGRDIGTKVFPGTPYKFFLTARPEVRAERRHRELAARGEAPPLEAVAEEMARRDAQDSSRADSPLTCDETYLRIDTSDLTLDEVVERVVADVRRRLPN